MNIKKFFFNTYLIGIVVTSFPALGFHNDFDLSTQKILSEKELRRYGHTVSLFDSYSGKLFIYGGYVSGQTHNWAGVRSDAYILNIFSGDKISVTASYKFGRVNHQSVQLKDGKIAIVGGRRDSYYYYSLPILIFDPTTNQMEKKSWSRDCIRDLASITLLADGNILIAGGLDEVDLSKFQASNKACLYDPMNDVYEILPEMGNRKYKHQATLLDDGRVLFSGGFNKEELYLNEIEVFDPQSKNFTKITKMSLGRIGHTATRLEDGRVLIAGGKMDDHVFHKHVEIFEPRSNSVTQTSNSLAVTRASHAALLLSNGNVVLVGGYSLRKELPDTIEVFNPKTDKFSESSHLSFPRFNPLIVEVSPSKILVSGGDGFKHYARKQELITLK